MVYCFWISFLPRLQVYDSSFSVVPFSVSPNALCSRSFLSQQTGGFLFSLHVVADCTVLGWLCPAPHWLWVSPVSAVWQTSNSAYDMSKCLWMTGKLLNVIKKQNQCMSCFTGTVRWKFSPCHLWVNDECVVSLLVNKHWTFLSLAEQFGFIIATSALNLSLKQILLLPLLIWLQWSKFRPFPFTCPFASIGIIAYKTTTETFPWKMPTP